MRAVAQRDAGLKGADAEGHGIGRAVFEFIGRDPNGFAAPRLTVVAAFPEKAFFGVDVENLAVGFVDHDFAAGIGADFARRAPRGAAVGAFAHRLVVKGEHVAVARGDEVASAAAVGEPLNAERGRTEKRLGGARDGVLGESGSVGRGEASEEKNEGDSFHVKGGRDLSGAGFGGCRRDAKFTELNVGTCAVGGAAVPDAAEVAGSDFD